MVNLSAFANAIIIIFTICYIMNLSFHIIILYDIHTLISDPNINVAFKYLLSSVSLEALVPILATVFLFVSGQLNNTKNSPLPLSFLIIISVILIISGVMSSLAVVEVAKSKIARKDYGLIIFTIALSFLAAILLIMYDVIIYYVVKEHSKEKSDMEINNNKI